jgi:hypothetical protein
MTLEQAQMAMGKGELTEEGENYQVCKWTQMEVVESIAPGRTVAAPRFVRGPTFVARFVGGKLREYHKL